MWHSLMTKSLIFHFLLFHFDGRGPEAHRQDSGQRRHLSDEREAIWDARSCTCSFPVQKHQQSRAHDAGPVAVIADMKALPATSAFAMSSFGCPPEIQDAKIPLNVEPENEHLKFFSQDQQGNLRPSC